MQHRLKYAPVSCFNLCVGFVEVEDTFFLEHYSHKRAEWNDFCLQQTNDKQSYPTHWNTPLCLNSCESGAQGDLSPSAECFFDFSTEEIRDAPVPLLHSWNQLHIIEYLPILITIWDCTQLFPRPWHCLIELNPPAIHLTSLLLHASWNPPCCFVFFFCKAEFSLSRVLSDLVMTWEPHGHFSSCNSASPLYSTTLSCFFAWCFCACLIKFVMLTFSTDSTLILHTLHSACFALYFLCDTMKDNNNNVT